MVPSVSLVRSVAYEHGVLYPCCTEVSSSLTTGDLGGRSVLAARLRDDADVAVTVEVDVESRRVSLPPAVSSSLKSVER
jgi:hypothetical protein